MSIGPLPPRRAFFWKLRLVEIGALEEANSSIQKSFPLDASMIVKNLGPVVPDQKPLSCRFPSETG